MACREPPPPPPPAANITYEEWLALKPDQRDRVRATWNPYQHENVHIPEEALRRLKATSSLKIIGGGVGIYHGGVYILNPMLAPEDLPKAPKWLATEHDGFLIGYTRYIAELDRLK